MNCQYIKLVNIEITKIRDHCTLQWYSLKLWVGVSWIKAIESLLFTSFSIWSLFFPKDFTPFIFFLNNLPYMESSGPKRNSWDNTQVGGGPSNLKRKLKNRNDTLNCDLNYIRRTIFIMIFLLIIRFVESFRVYERQL